MEYQRETLSSKLRSYFKKGIYAPLIAGAIAIGSYTSPANAQQTRTTESETFDNGTTSKSYIAQDADKWFFRNARLEADDFEGAQGHTRFNFNDKLYDLKTTNMSLEVTIDKSAWGLDTDRIGLTFSGDPTQGNNGTYYQFRISAYSGVLGQFDISRQTPGLNHSYVHGTSNYINSGGINTLAVVYNDKAEFTDNKARTITTGYNFFINDNKIVSSNIASIPPLEGFVGNTLYDDTTSAFTSTTYYDNFNVEYDTPQGGGASKRIKKNLFERGNEAPKPFVPDILLRGDANMDGAVDISDAIYTLNYLYQEEVTPRCLDAADTNDDEAVDLSDPIKTIFHLFQGDAILPPNIGGSGMDLTKSDYNAPLPKCEGLPYTSHNTNRQALIIL